jgi:hypothetical protein
MPPFVMAISNLIVIEGINKIPDFDEEISIVSSGIRHLSLISSSPAWATNTPRSIPVALIYSPRVSYKKDVILDLPCCVHKWISTNDRVCMTSRQGVFRWATGVATNKIVGAKGSSYCTPNQSGIVIDTWKGSQLRWSSSKNVIRFRLPSIVNEFVVAVKLCKHLFHDDAPESATRSFSVK